MTEETDISKVLIEGDYATIMGVKYKRVGSWLPPERVESKYDADYNAGWNDCLDELKKQLR
jgi:hypothetical protein